MTWDGQWTITFGALFAEKSYRIVNQHLKKILMHLRIDDSDCDKYKYRKEEHTIATVNVSGMDKQRQMAVWDHMC